MLWLKQICTVVWIVVTRTRDVVVMKIQKTRMNRKTRTNSVPGIVVVVMISIWLPLNIIS